MSWDCWEFLLRNKLMDVSTSTVRLGGISHGTAPIVVCYCNLVNMVIDAIRILPPELQERANKELNEVPNRIHEDIRYIKQWIEKQPYLNARTDDQWLLAFLRGCKFSLEKTKDKLDTYYALRQLTPEFYADRDPSNPKLQDILNRGLCLPLIPDDKTLPTYFLLRNDGYDPSEVLIKDIYKVIFMIADICFIENDAMMVNGAQVVIDQSNMELKHFPTPALAKKMATCFQEAFPIRPKGIHFLDTTGYFHLFFNLLKPFLNEKMKSRIAVYSGDYKEMYKTISRKYLPNEYGGDYGSIRNIAAIWKEKVESYRNWFLEDAKYGTDESLRPGKPKFSIEFFGVEGTFRKLEVD